MPRVNTPCIPDRFRYTRNVSETTDAGFSSLRSCKRINRAERFFYAYRLRAPLLWASFGGGASRLAGCLRDRSANPAICSPTPFSSGTRVNNSRRGRIMRQAPARSEQPKPQTPTQRHPLFARAGSAAADLWLNCPVLSLADFRDLRFRTLLSGLTSDPDDNARRLAFNAAYAARIASSIAEQSHAGVHHG
jgi:hypothetical protein